MVNGRVAAAGLGIGLGVPLAYLLYPKLPPPKAIRNVVSKIKIVRTYFDTCKLTLKFLSRIGNAFVYIGQTPPDVQYPSACEVFVTMFFTTPTMVSVEFSRSAYAKLDLYFDTTLLATMPDYPGPNQLAAGYYQMNVAV